MYPALNQTPYPEDVWGSGGGDPHINLGPSGKKKYLPLPRIEPQLFSL
jgi:hypothetical protein